MSLVRRGKGFLEEKRNCGIIEELAKLKEGLRKRAEREGQVLVKKVCAVTVLLIAVFLFSCSSQNLSQQKSATVEKVDLHVSKPRSGEEIFRTYCIGCHGLYGRGNGPNAKNIAKAYGVGPANLASQKVQVKSDEVIKETIKMGGKHMGLSPYMPAWGMTLSEEEIENVVRYIRELPKIEEPSLTKAVPPETVGERIKRGKRIFLERCSPCHGLDGKGKGPEWRRKKAKDPDFPETPDFTNPRYMNTLTDEQIEERIRIGYAEGGKRIMPPWGDKLNHEERLNVILYIRTLHQRGP